MPPTKRRARRTGVQRNPMVNRQPRGVNRQLVPKLLDVLEWTEFEVGPDGQPDHSKPIDGVTIGDRIIDSVRRNLGVTEACKAAGIDESTYHDWLRSGAKVAAERAAMTVGNVPYRKLSQRDSAVWWFWQQVGQAEAEAERRLVHTLDQLATGEGLVETVITRKLVPDPTGARDAEGRPVMIEADRTEKRNRVLPDGRHAQWLLARKHPERYANTDTLEVIGGGGAGSPIEHHHTHSVPALEDMLDKVAAKIEGRPQVEAQTADDLGHIPPLVEPIEATATEA